MRIGLFDPYLDSMSGGEKYMLTMATCLANSGHTVSLFWNKQDESAIRNTSLKKLGIDLSKVSFSENIFDINLSLLKRLFTSRNFDAIIILSDGSIPVVFSRLFVHFQFPVEWVHASLKLRLKLSRVEQIICNSAFTKSFIDRKFHKNSTILFPPITIHKTKEIKKENIVLHVGRFSGNKQEGTNYKKQDVMIDVFKDMVDRKRHKDWKFVMIISVMEQDRDMYETLKRKAKGYPIVFVEGVSNETLWEYYQKAKIYWHASGYGEDLAAHPEKAEHFGIATVEAMSKGAVPVVVRAGGQVEIVENDKNGYLWESTEELITYTEKIMDDERLRSRLALEAVRRAQFFAGERFCKEVNSIFS